MSEVRIFKVKVGERGEIYTTKEIRELAGIEAPGELILIVRRGEIIIKKLPLLEELLNKKPLLEMTFEEAERLSEEMQRERGYETFSWISKKR